jgi:CAAX protease family protein
LAGVTTFLAAVFGVSWGLYFLLRVAITAGEQWAVLTWLLATVWTPTFTAFLISWWAGGLAAVKTLALRLIPRRGTFRWLLLACAVPAVITSTAVVSARGLGDEASYIAPSGVLPMVVLQLITGATGEEFGWRGFLLAELEMKLGSLRAALVMAALWSLWHVSGFLIPGVPQQIVPPGLFLSSVALFGIFLALLFFLSRGNVLATILAHLSLNVTLGLGGVQPASLVFWWMMVGILGTVAIVSLHLLRIGWADLTRR